MLSVNAMSLEFWLSALAVCAVAWNTFKGVAKATETKTDDKIVEEVEKAVKWGYKNGGAIWSIVELMKKQDISAKAKQGATFLQKLHERWLQTHPEYKVMPKEAETAALQRAEELSAMDKLAKVNFQPAPKQD